MELAEYLYTTALLPGKPWAELDEATQQWWFEVATKTLEKISQMAEADSGDEGLLGRVDQLVRQYQEALDRQRQMLNRMLERDREQRASLKDVATKVWNWVVQNRPPIEYLNTADYGYDYVDLSTLEDAVQPYLPPAPPVGDTVPGE